MSGLVCPNAGEIILLRYIVNMSGARDTSDQPLLRLYNNNVDPGETSTETTFTEPTIGGYHLITLTGAGWTITQLAGVTTAVYSEETFTFTTGVSIYGYYVTNSAGNIMWAEKFTGAPFELPASGGNISITAKLTLE